MADGPTTAAWAILRRHAHECRTIRLKELLADADRVASLVAVRNEGRMLVVDLARQHVTTETLAHLLRLAQRRKLWEFVRSLAYSAQSPSQHVAYRIVDPTASVLDADDKNILPGIHERWEHIRRWSDRIRTGVWRGASGALIRDVIVVGSGVSMATLAFVYKALLHDEAAEAARRETDATTTATTRLLRRSPHTRQLHLMTSIDPSKTTKLMAELDPASTLVVSIALQGNEETGLATQLLKQWLLQHLTPRPDVILNRHMVLVTANDRIAQVINKPDSVHVLPVHSRCDGLVSFSATTLVPLSVIFGWDLCLEWLKGAHDMDNHVMTTNPRHTLPVLLALMDVWHGVQDLPRVQTPFTDCLQGFPGLMVALEAQLLSGGERRPSLLRSGNEAMDRTLYQGEKQSVEWLMTLDTQVNFHSQRVVGDHMNDVFATEDAQLCALFAHADEMALGKDKSAVASPSNASIGTMTLATTAVGADYSGGNRPSTLILCDKLDAFMCGQLVALAEHRVLIHAHLCGIDPYVSGLGSSLRTARAEQLKDDLQYLFMKKEDTVSNEDHNEIDETEKDPTQNLNLSTRTILDHYAAMMTAKRQGGAPKPRLFL